MSSFLGLPTLVKATPNGPLEWTISVKRTKTGGRIIVEYGLRGGKMQLQKEDITEGKNVGRRNETTPYEQACLEAKARWEKQKSRKGYGFTEQESAEVRAASPMLAQVYEKQRIKVHWDTACAQPKLDGFRALCRKVGKKVVFTSRENQPMPALSHIGDALKHFLPEGVTLDGEMYCHGMSLNKISSACKKKSDLSRKIQFHVYDLISEEAFEDRATDLYAIMRKVITDDVRSVETVKVRSEGELMVCQKEFIDRGYEGAMLRHGHAGYEAGMRSAHLLKVKTFTDGEFIIVDFKLGRGKYAGMPIFTCQTKKGHDFDVLAPGDLDEKRELGKIAGDLMGRRMKVKFAYFTKTAEPVPFLPVAICLLEE